MTRWMGVDLGTRRIGIALSDPKGTFALPYVTLPRTSDEQDARAIAEMAKGEGVRTVVLGHPLALDGSRGDPALVAEAFGQRLREAGARVKLWDERLTTVEAEKRLKGRGMKGRQRRAVVDKLAAAVLLQSFLDTRAT